MPNWRRFAVAPRVVLAARDLPAEDSVAGGSGIVVREAEVLKGAVLKGAVLKAIVPKKVVLRDVVPDLVTPKRWLLA